MNHENTLATEAGSALSQSVRKSVRQIERREWWLWSYAVLVTILLATTWTCRALGVPFSSIGWEKKPCETLRKVE
jgi:hypothetical protein